jgi:hypothetical protein
MGIALSGTAHLVCSPDQPGGTERFDPAWRTETVKALTKGIMVDYAFDRFPILADALEEAGCNDPILLRHCRECSKHAHSCWVLTCISERPMPQLDEQRILAELDDIVPPHSRRVPQPPETENQTGWYWDDSYDRRRSSPTQRAVVGLVLFVIILLQFLGYFPRRQPQFLSSPAQKLPVVKKYD